MCKLWILCIGRNYHSIRPEVCALFRHTEAHILVFFKDISSIAAVNNGNILVAVSHRINDFIGNVSGFHSVVDRFEPLISLVYLVLVFGIHGIAESLESRHKRISFGVIDIYSTLVLCIAKYLITLFLYFCGIYDRLIVNKTDIAPEIRHGIAVIGVVVKILYTVAKVFKIGDKALVQLL